MFENNEFLTSLAYCGFILILALIFYYNPPQKINALYGYRTARSKTNSTVWKAANSYANKTMLILSIASFLIPVLTYFIAQQYTLLVTLIGSTLLIILVIPLTEIYLNKRFKRDGTPK